jgi:Na+-transporting NADH:ubiquinone oxidoreductase subunit NqrC
MDDIYMKMKTKEIIDYVLKISLVIALLCSIFITVQAFMLNNTEYKTRFLAWQTPMILALLTEIYLL